MRAEIEKRSSRLDDDDELTKYRVVRVRASASRQCNTDVGILRFAISVGGPVVDMPSFRQKFSGFFRQFSAPSESRNDENASNRFIKKYLSG